MRILLLPLSVLIVLAADGPNAWTPAHSMQVQPVADVIPSPDGRRVVWTQTRAVLQAEKSEQITHIFLGRTGNAEPVQLTRGEKSATRPTFSPDGTQVFFLSERSGKQNLYRIPISGGEAEQLTDWKGTLFAYRVSPDGRRVAFTGAGEDKEEEKRKKEKADYTIIDANPKNHTLYLMALDGEMPGKPEKLIEAIYHIGDFDWSPDSRYVAFERRPAPEQDDARRADLVEVEVATKALREIAATAATELLVGYSPDGRQLALLRSSQTPRPVDGYRLALYSRSDGGIRELPPTFDNRPSPIDWSPDSSRIYYWEPKGTRAALYAMPVDGPPVALYLPQRGRIGPARLNASGTHLGLTFETPEQAVEAYVTDTAAPAKLVRVSEANTALSKPPLGKTELVRWKATDGLEIEGLLTYPVDYRAGARVPLILNIHGGPSGVFGEGFIGAAGLYPIASFAAKGFAVLRPNPRGSTGYGQQFRQSVIQDWGGLDFQDLMAGVDQAIAMGIADPERLAVMGWSYGGYMTAWAVTQTTRFKAAAVGAGITNTVSMYGTQDIPGVFEDYFGGTPWNQPAVYARSSPLNFVHRVKTPTLILHGENDARVPPGQAQEFYRALKRQGVPTRMILYPRTPHGPREPKFQLHIMEQHLEWVEKNLQ